MAAKDFFVIGKNISYSLSPELYRKLWEKRGEVEYTFGIKEVEDLRAFMEEVREREEPIAFTVTSPYKEEIIPFLDRLTPDAECMHAVNTVRREAGGDLVGHNTDIYGFIFTLPRLLYSRERALVCGSGGASKAVQEGLRRLGIPFEVASRGAGGTVTYDDLTSVEDFTHLINATPLGSVKVPDLTPPLPYDSTRSGIVYYDLNYAPTLTPFMAEGIKRGACAVNGLAMLSQMIERVQWKFLSSGEIEEVLF